MRASYSDREETRCLAPEAPAIYELMDQYKTSEINRRVAHVLLGGAEFGRFMLVTPGNTARPSKDAARRLRSIDKGS